MKKLVFFPSDPIKDYLEKGRNYTFLDQYYNPGGYFDEVYCLSPWGEEKEEIIGNIHYIKASQYDFAKIIKKINPDVMRGYGGYCCADWISFNKVKGIPTVVSVHDPNPELIHDSLKYADALICTSQKVKDAVLRLVPDVTPNIWVMPNRVDTDVYKKHYDNEFFEELNKRFPAKKHILHVGRKTETKNLDTVIKAMKYLDDDVVTVFVGQGDIKEYKELAEKEGVDKRCYFVKRVPSEELPLWYSWCDCMCTPSRWEGFGCVFVEAAACEAVVVTSNIAPMKEYLTNMVDSVLVDDYEEPKEVAKAIEYVLQGTEEIKLLGKRARKVGLRFSKQAVDEQEIAIYEEIMKIRPNNKNNVLLKVQMKQKEYKKRIKNLTYKFLEVSGIKRIGRRIKRIIKKYNEKDKDYKVGIK